MTIDFFSTLPHYESHMAGIWDALPHNVRGTWYRNVSHPPEDGTPCLVASYGDLCATVGRPIAFLEHGNGSYYGGASPGFSGGPDRDVVGLFLCPSETVAKRNLDRYPDSTAAVVGVPALDAWHCEHTPPRSHGGGWFEGHNAPRGPINSPPFCQCGDPFCPNTDGPGPWNGADCLGLGISGDKRPVIALAWHWDLPGPREGGTAWPVFAQHLRPLVDAFPTVLGHGHPRALNGELSHVYRHLGIEIVATADEVLDRADCLVFDVTSFGYEFASTGRPVVCLDDPEWRQDASYFPRFSPIASAVGLHCDNPSALVETVRLALEDPPVVRRARQAAIDIVYSGGCDGHAAERAAAALMAWEPDPSRVRVRTGRG